MLITPFPTRITLLAEKLSDPRVGPAVFPTKPRAPAPIPVKADCDCPPAAPTPDPGWERSKRLDAYLKTRSPMITPLGPPPGDRRILAEAGIDLKQFRARPPGVTPLGRSELIKPLRVPFRSPSSPEVLRALWNHLSRVRSMPKEITPLTTYFGLKLATKGGGAAAVPSATWASYADAVGVTAMHNVFPSPLGGATESAPPLGPVCRCELPKSRSPKGNGA